MGELFGTDGVRGVANEYPMTAEMALNIGRATAHLFKRKGHTPNIIIFGQCGSMKTGHGLKRGALYKRPKNFFGNRTASHSPPGQSPSWRYYIRNFMAPCRQTRINIGHHP